ARVGDRLDQAVVVVGGLAAAGVGVVDGGPAAPEVVLVGPLVAAGVGHRDQAPGPVVLVADRVGRAVGVGGVEIAQLDRVALGVGDRGGRPPVGVDDRRLRAVVDGRGAPQLLAEGVEHLVGDAAGRVPLVGGHARHLVVRDGEQRGRGLRAAEVGAVLLTHQAARVVEGVGEDAAAAGGGDLRLHRPQQAIEQLVRGGVVAVGADAVGDRGRGRVVVEVIFEGRGRFVSVVAGAVGRP